VRVEMSYFDLSGINCDIDDSADPNIPANDVRFHKCCA
jgi:hypothetical protein